jgi:sensor histidine kinase YesM
MEHMEMYWEVLSCVVSIVCIGITGCLFCRLVNPFLEKRKNAIAVGVTYFATMLVMYFIPYEMKGMTAYAIGTWMSFMVMYFLERRNIEQKVFLAVVMYLLNWISKGIALVPRAIVLKMIDVSRFISSRQLLLLGCYAVEEIFNVMLIFLLMAFLIRMIDKVYVCKKENMSRKELGLMLATPLLVLLGYGSFSFFSNSYVADTGQYIWNIHSEYEWITALYQMISYIAIITVIVFYQNIKESHRREKENAVLAEQIISMENHISEVELLYRDIRSLKHDMGNHVTVLENLVRNNEQQEAAKYLSELKEQYLKTDTGVKSGNPVTDVILTEKQKEAKNRGIAFVSDFHYPEETKINAFDVSVILNNAVGNAIEAAAGCDKPYVHIKSYRKNNAYMIEVSNNFSGNLIMNEESGLPESTKEGEEHGYGLLNIRKVAQKYYGDIDTTQDRDEFRLSIMLMLE